ncbi:MAG: hypothetical protein ABIE84_01410 [bacterium]
MNVILPLRFYQVKTENETFETVSQKFNVRQENIERDYDSIPDQPLQKGEMLFIRNF